MQRHVIKGKYELFTQVETASHDARMERKSAQIEKGMFSRTKVESISIYKLHITLIAEDYKSHQDAITQIILKYLDDKSMPVFKYANSDVMVQQREELEHNLQVMLKEINKANADDELINRIADTKDQILQANRFINSDQFTLYLARNFNKETLGKLCNEIEEYIQEHKLQPGKMYDVESPITKNISLRQIYTLQDYHRMSTLEHHQSLNLNGVELKDEKIETLASSGKKHLSEKRLIALKEQNESPLYKYLVANVNCPHHSIANVNFTNFPPKK
jgi:hypothetical protein